MKTAFKNKIGKLKIKTLLLPINESFYSLSVNGYFGYCAVQEVVFPYFKKLSKGCRNINVICRILFTFILRLSSNYSYLKAHISTVEFYARTYLKTLFDFLYKNIYKFLYRNLYREKWG